MKNNIKLTYILLPLVVIVWGLVVYRIFFEGRTAPENISSVPKPVLKESVKEEKSSYKLIANYRDPFLSNVIQPNVEINDEKDKEKEEDNRRGSNLRRRRTSISRTRWPEVSYGGFIEDDNDRKITILLNIKNRDYLAQEGDTIDQIYIKAFYGDSLIIIYNEEEKTLTKKNN